jgi:glycosyltransferase involved in cell wall biosynthesis
MKLNEISNTQLNMFHQKNGKAYLNSVFGGGAYTFLLNQKQLNPLLIIDTRNFKKTFKVSIFIDAEEKTFNFNSLQDIINYFQIKTLYINHLIWSKNFSELIDYILKETTNIDLQIMIHDFFMACPTINLLNYNGTYCGVPDTNTCKICIRRFDYSHNAIDVSKLQMKLYSKELNGDIDSWRQLWRKILNKASIIYTPSNSTADIFNKAYKNKYIDKIIVAPHPLDYITNISPKINNVPQKFLNLYILGHVADVKGGRIIKELIKKTADAQLCICYNVLGDFSYPEYIYTPFFKLHGTYDHNKLDEVFHRHSIDAFLFLSICPETFSYVLNEMMVTKLPIIGINIGSQGEFLSSYPNALLVNSASADEVFLSITNFYHKHLEKLYPILDNDRRMSMNKDDEINKLVEIIQQQEMEIKEQLCHIKELNDYTHRIANSISWKITKPLRLFKKVLKKIIG